MLKLTFEINGRPVDPNSIEDAIQQAVLSEIEEQIRRKLAGIRDPETGEFPVIAVRGHDLEHLSFQVSGSEGLIKQVKKHLNLEAEGLQETDDGEASMTKEVTDGRVSLCAFLCHASEDKALARRIAEDFQRNGIDTFFDTWEIGPGDSLRQKIDAGLGRCTHFVVLLTPTSIQKPWVNAEMDAGFVRKVSGQCRFIALRYRLEADSLPPLLRALYSPSLDDYERDIAGLINWIHGVSEKPPLGPAPEPIRKRVSGNLGLSPGAEMIARIMVERSEHGITFDPQIGPEELREATKLPDEDVVDAVEELEGRGFVRRQLALGTGPLGFVALSAEAALFVELDKHFKEWDPANDALRIAADLVNAAGNGNVPSTAERYGWPPRRMNPAINYLIEHRLVDFSRSLGTHPWCTLFIVKNAATRRFVRDRS